MHSCDDATMTTMGKSALDTAQYIEGLFVGMVIGPPAFGVEIDATVLRDPCLSAPKP